MDRKRLNQTIITFSIQEDILSRWIESFLVDRKAKGLSVHSVKFYRVELSQFLKYCDGQVINQIGQLSPDVIRRYLLYLEESGRNPGGIHAAFRALHAFFLWFEEETEPDGWKNPIRKVKAPKVPTEEIEPVELETVQAIIKQCKGNGFTSVRDRSLLLFLLDTGARAFEVCAVNLEDVDLMTGSVLIRQGKGRKPRTVFLGQKSRRSIRGYLKQRADDNPALWVTDDQERLTYWGLNEIIRRRAKAAGVAKPGLHDFRRAFALNFLRNNPGDIYSLQKLGGWKDLQVIRRYLAQTDQDLQEAHRRGSPVDHSNL